MLSTARVIAFAATLDGARARDFYEGKLGLRLIKEDEFAIVFDAHGTEFRVQKVEALRPQGHTLLGWSVASIDQIVVALKTRGVRFERYENLDQTADGIWTSPSGAKIAWMKDPDGNVLSLTGRN